jgi:lysophospholipase L1-like esterase
MNKATATTALRGAARWTLLAGVCLLTLEVAARVDDWLTYGAPLLGTYNIDQLFQVTPEGLRGVPHGRYAKWQLNAQGYRGPEVRSDSGQIRVVTYGASETFGIYENPGQEFPRVLERDLNATGDGAGFEVVNAAMPGMRVGSGVSYLQEIGAQLHPQVVIIYPTPTHYIGVTRPYCGRTAQTASVPPPQPPELRVLQKARDRLKEVLPRAALTWVREAGIGWSNRGRVVLDRVAPESLEAFRADLLCAIRASREIGAVPIVMTHANRFAPTARPDDAYWLTGWRLQYPELRQSGLLALEKSANAVVRSVAQEQGVPLVDASAVLSGDPGSFADHAHFTDLGSKRVADLLTVAVLRALKP